MSRRPKTPEELAPNPGEKKSVALYLDVQDVEYLKKRASKAGTSLSAVVGEAIKAYIEAINGKKTD